MGRSRLGLFESVTGFPVSTRAAGTYTEPFQSEGNSLISSLFVQSIDPGATLKVSWWDSGAGTDFGERFDLEGHPLVIAPIAGPFTDRRTVSRIHNKPNLEAVVTGGSATFGVYFTVVSSFAADSGAALMAQGQDFDASLDRGTPVALYDSIAGKWFFARGNGGLPDVNVVGSVVTGRIPGTLAGLPFGTTLDLFNFTATGALLVPSIIAGGESYGTFELFVRGASWGIRRNSWAQRQVSFDAGVIKLGVGDTLRLAATNTSISGNVADYEGFAYYGT